MSVVDFQRVMAHLIRFPATSLEEAEERLGGLVLSTEDRNRLDKMARDPLVRKFGQKMSYLRLRDALTVMPLTRRFVKEEDLHSLFYTVFEPSRTSTDFVMVGVQFLECLIEVDACREILKRYPSFVIDILKYEHTKAFVERQVIYYNDERLPKGSALRHIAFSIIDLKHEIPVLDQRMRNNADVASKPSPKEMKLLFMRSETAPYYRMFQIDGEIESYLVAQRDCPSRWTKGEPKAYDGMAKVGLCLPSPQQVVGALS